MVPPETKQLVNGAQGLKATPRLRRFTQTAILGLEKYILINKGHEKLCCAAIAV